MNALRVNPVLERELRERMRTTGAVVLLTLYLALLVGVFYLVYKGQTSGSGFTSRIAPTEVARVGRGIFEWVLFFMMALVLFIVPGYTAAAIAGERERQTLVPMQVTLLRPGSIAIGKISASLAYLVLLMIATAPLLALSYLIGGVSLRQGARGLAAILFVGLVLACLSVACSAVAKRVQTATVLAYGLTLLMVLGSLIVYAAATVAINSDRSLATGSTQEKRPPVALVALNPVLLVSAAIDGENLGQPLDEGTGATGRTNSIFQPVREMMHPRQTFNARGGMDVAAIGANGQIIQQAGNNQAQLQPSGFEDFVPWSIFAFTVLGALSVVLAARRLRAPAEAER